MAPIIFLLTDFGAPNEFMPCMNCVILGLYPPAALAPDP